MSQVPSTATSSTDFETIFGAALEAYKTQTKKDIALHPLATQLQSCDSPSAILAVLRAQVQAFDETHSADEKLTKWLDPTVNVLYAFAATLGNGVGLIFPPSNAVFSGIGILLQAVKDVRASQDALVDLFGRIESFFKRLEAYIEVRPTAAMTDVIVKIMVEVLSILGILTKEIGQGRMKKYLKELVGKKDVKDAVERLDKLTQEEAGMAAIEALKIGRGIGDIVKDIDAKAEHIDERVQVVRVKVEEVDEKVQSVDNKVQGVDHKVDSVIEGIKETGVAIRQVASLNRSGKRKDLQGWISPPDPSVNYNTACRAHHRGTAAWCTQGDTFVDWKASGSLLWIHGKPGSGKTILNSVIIRDIKSLSNAGSACMAYFFFDFKDTGKQGSRALLSSILVQLSNRSERCCDVLHELYSAHQNGAEQPTDNSLMQCLKDMLTIAEQVPIYIIMDALDECPNDSGMPSSRETVLELVEELVRLGRSNLRLCVTSRLEFDIRITLEPLAVHQVSLSDESGQKQDIIDYVTFVVCSDRRMKRWRDDDKDAVIETLTKKANGMFQWVFCHLEVLRHCFPNDVHRVLKELPESLDKTYERILKQIPKANRRHAYRLLQCIMTAIQPLRVEELAEVLALDFSTGAIPSLNTDWRWEDQAEAVLSACSSLVTVIVNNGSRVVQFSHFSVQEFLASDRLASSIDEVSHFHILFGPSHAMFVRACLGALVRLGDHADDRSVEQIPLVRYAARNWALHAYFGSTELHIRDAMEYFLDMDRPHFKTWVTIQGPDIMEMFSEVRSGLPQQFLPPAAPLYFAARSRFHGLVERLVVKYPQQVNACGGERGTPLHVSVFMGHIDVAQLLFAYGADINSCSADERTPLHIASEVGNLEIGRWLLNHGADVNTEDDDGSTPLHLAASNGHLEVSRMLLEHNAEVDALDGCGNTPFLNASVSGNADIVQLFLDHSTDAHVRDNRGNNALHLATTCDFATTFGKLDIVRILLPLNVEVNAKNDIGSTPLLKASARGSPDIVRLLLDHDADAGVRDNSGDTPLHNAACGGHIEVAQMLLERNVEVDAQNDEGSTVLLRALKCLNSSQGPRKVAELLLEHGANAHVRDNDGNTSLHIAASRGYLKVTRILLERNAEVNTRDDDGSTPLLKASASGHHDVVQLLLDNDADADVRDNNGNTALHLAAAGGVFGVDLNRMAKLFAPVAKADVRKYGGSVTIRRTSESNSWGELWGSGGSPEVVRLLLDHGMGVQVRNDWGKTASEVARGPRREQIVQLLSGNAVECEVECTSERPWAALDDVDLRALAAMYGSRPF